MKLFRTGCIAVVTDCQKFSYFLSVTYQIDLRTVKFLQKFQSSDNHICNLFWRKQKFAWRIFSVNMGVRSTMSMTWKNYWEHFIQ